MALETKLSIRRKTSGLDLHDLEDVFLRRDYDAYQQFSLALMEGAKTAVRSTLTNIEFVYVKSDGVTVQIFKNRSPESWSFDTCLLVVDTSIEELSLKADEDTTVQIFIAGS